MKKLITLLTLPFVTVVFGQTANSTTIFVATFDSIFKVLNFDDSATFDVTGMYVTSDGFVGYNFILDSNQSFRKTGFSCSGKEMFDSGRWSLQNGNTLILTGHKTTANIIIKLGTYYYLVPLSEKRKLVNDYLETRDRFKRVKPITVDGHTFSIEYMIRYKLLEKYYSKDPMFDFTGT